jgi:hypothetical protein
MNAWHWVIRAAIITPNAVSVNESKSNSPASVRDVREAGQGKEDHALEGGDRGTAKAFADNDR